MWVRVISHMLAVLIVMLIVIGTAVAVAVAMIINSTISKTIPKSAILEVYRVDVDTDESVMYVNMYVMAHGFSSVTIDYVTIEYAHKAYIQGKEVCPGVIIPVPVRVEGPRIIHPSSLSRLLLIHDLSDACPGTKIKIRIKYCAGSACYDIIKVLDWNDVFKSA